MTEEDRPCGGVIVEMSELHFDHAIQTIKKSHEIAKQIRSASKFNLDRLGIQPNLRRCVKGPGKPVPNTNTGSLIDWMNRIQVGDAAAITQLVAVHATACAQCGPDEPPKAE